MQTRPDMDIKGDAHVLLYLFTFAHILLLALSFSIVVGQTARYWPDISFPFTQNF